MQNKHHFSLDPNGHTFSELAEYWSANIIQEALLFSSAWIKLEDPSNNDSEIFEAALENKSLITTPINCKVERNSALCCDHCQERDFVVEGTVIQALKPCMFPQGQIFTATLDVPSGKIAVTDNFHYLFDIKEPSSMIDETQSSWAERLMKEYAQQGLLTFLVSNTSPEIFKDISQSDTFHVASDFEWQWDEETDEEIEIHPNFGKSLFTVWTGLWWVSMLDASKVASLPEEEKKHINYIDVTPGKYILEYKFFDKTSPENYFGTLKRVEE